MIDIDAILERQDKLYRHQPKCPACGHVQIQLMISQPPARWRCRQCRHHFESEPNDG